MSIHVSGCVKNSDEFNIVENCTLREAIALAGGLKDKVPFIPTGIITIKTKKSSTENQTRKTVNFIEFPSVLDDEVIYDNEILIVQTDGDVLLR